MRKTDSTKRAQEKRRGFTKKIGNTTYDVSFHYSQEWRKYERQNYPSDRKRYARHEKELNMCIVGVPENA